MRIRKQKHDQVLILTIIESRLDANNASQFKSEMQRLMKENARGLLINISCLEFIDSTGLGAIVKGLRVVDGHTAVAVCGAREPILTMFKLTRIDKVLKVFATEAEALGYLEANLVLA